MSGTAAPSGKKAARPAQALDLQAVFFVGILTAVAAWGLLDDAVPLRLPTLIFAAALLFVTSFSHSAGYHRMYAHRSFRGRGVLRVFFALAGSANFIGSLLEWCRLHRAHHRELDTERDPFTPRRGLFYLWIGSRFVTHPEATEVDIADLTVSRLVRLQNTFYPLFALFFGLAAPAIIAAAWGDALGGLVYAGAIRALLFLFGHYTAWALCHTTGHQPYSEAHSGYNNVIASLFTLGYAHFFLKTSFLFGIC